MAEYIERTKELVLAMNAGARVIENTRRYHGTVYSKDVFSETPQKIPYLQAAKVLREVSDAPDADVAPVVRCKDCRSYNKPKTGWCEVHLDREHPDDFCSYGERKDGGADHEAD